ncbi:MAG: methyltransferase domain-containing protein [Bradyrhizobium sp.]
MSDHIVAGRSAAYREASEAIHRDCTTPDRHAKQFRMLWDCGYADLIRKDFYSLFEFPAGVRGDVLEAGCGTGIEAVNLRRLAPGLKTHGVDISSVALADAVARPDKGDAAFYQASLERLPFADAVFDYISSHEVIEHVEDPAIVLAEFRRVLKPGGVCVIATPNGASWWIDHLRQRVMRLFGRRGAPVGADHTRPPSFWRREFTRAGFVLERQIFDAAAIEFQCFVAPASWMPVTSRLFEPLRTVPLINLWLCDRVKFRLRRPGIAAQGGEVRICCPICHASLATVGAGVRCGNGHAFVRNTAGLIDFTCLAAAAPAGTGMRTTAPAASASATAAVPAASRPRWLRRLRRLVLLGLSVGYAGFLLTLAPLGLVMGCFSQPFRRG